MEFDENLNPIKQPEGADWNQPEPDMPADQPQPAQNSFDQPINQHIEPNKIIEPTPPPPPPPVPPVHSEMKPKDHPTITFGHKHASLWTLIIIFVLMTTVAIIAIAFNTNDQILPSASIAEQGLRITETGKAYATPDVAKVTFGVTTEAKDIAKSQKDNSEKLATIKNELARFNIEAKDIKTVNYSIYPDYDYFIPRQPRLKGYRTHHLLEIVIRKLEDTDAVVQALGTAGVTEINQVRFTVDDITEVQNEAREQAIAKAKDKAESLANLTGAKLGKIISIQEGSSQIIPPSYKSLLEMDSGFGGGAEVGLEEGSTLITATITIIYSLN